MYSHEWLEWALGSVKIHSSNTPVAKQPEGYTVIGSIGRTNLRTRKLFVLAYDIQKEILGLKKELGCLEGSPGAKHTCVCGDCKVCAVLDSLFVLERQKEMARGQFILDLIKLFPDKLGLLRGMKSFALSYGWTVSISSSAAEPDVAKTKDLEKVALTDSRLNRMLEIMHSSS